MVTTTLTMQTMTPNHPGYEMTKRTTALLVANHSLFGDCLEKLLADDERLCLHRTLPGQYQKRLRQIYRNSPVALLVEKEAFGEDVTDWARLLAGYGRLQILIISSESNEIQVYGSHTRTVTGAPDLLRLVHAFTCVGG
ncbi:MAG TPA: hypothetical protein PLD25_19605 [Chloroflexota bacterium]|nr:hypothetical protein [Chloroflexota bacterium]HUM69997.1 hypothetical protein [Chloroflexota bacterium]